MNLIYKSKRIGKNGRVFTMYKVRTMVLNADKLGGPSTSGDDPRLTKIGRLLRKFKLDEIPTLWNVIKGDMAIVGPRPEVPSEIETLDEETRKILLSVKPGMTSPATLWDLHEEEVLRGSQDPHKTYCEVIKPEKMRLNIEYIKNKSLWLDTKIIVKTIWRLFARK